MGLVFGLQRRVVASFFFFYVLDLLRLHVELYVRAAS